MGGTKKVLPGEVRYRTEIEHVLPSECVRVINIGSDFHGGLSPFYVVCQTNDTGYALYKPLDDGGWNKVVDIKR